MTGEEKQSSKKFDRGCGARKRANASKSDGHTCIDIPRFACFPQLVLPRTLSRAGHLESTEFRGGTLPAINSIVRGHVEACLHGGPASNDDEASQVSPQRQARRGRGNAPRAIGRADDDPPDPTSSAMV